MSAACPFDTAHLLVDDEFIQIDHRAHCGVLVVAAFYLKTKRAEENSDFCFATTCAKLGLVGLAAAALCYTFPALAYKVSLRWYLSSAASAASLGSFQWLGFQMLWGSLQNPNLCSGKILVFFCWLIVGRRQTFIRHFLLFWVPQL